MRRFLLVLLAMTGAHSASAQLVLTTANVAVTENFDTLANAGTASTFPNAWGIGETGTNANATYTAGTGSSNAGDSYSFGAAAAADRALGGVQSGSLVPRFGASFQNGTGAAITGLTISYVGEQWRLGTAGRADRIDFQYSLDATSLATGTWIDVDALDFSSPFTTTVGAVDGNAAANRTAISATISSISIPNSSVFWIRWNDFNATGADDGLAVDDFSITPIGSGTAVGLSIDDVSVVEGNAGNTTATFTVALNAPAPAGGVSFDIATVDGTATAGSDYLARALTAQTIAPGGTSYTFAVSVIGDTVQEANETFGVSVSNIVGAVASDAQGLGTIINDDVVVTPINAVQGSGLVSPLAGNTVTVEGIVTGVKVNGYFLQSADADADADPATSEGILLFTGAAPPASVVVGARVRVTGTVLEFVPAADPAQPPTTELVAPFTDLTVISTGNALPTAAVISAIDPAGSFNQLENLEHMRVQFAGLRVVAPTDGFVNEPNATGSSNGIFWATLPKAMRPRREPGIDIRETLLPETPPGVPRFDTNPETLRVDSDGLLGAVALELAAGQSIGAISGILDYGRRFYTFLPSAGQVLSISPAPTPNVATTGLSDELTVASYNLERFFDDVNDPAIGEPVLTTVAYQGRLAKASRQIRQNLAAPDVLGVIEVENLATLQALAARIASDGGPTYQAFLEEGNDPGGIDVGFLVKVQNVVGSTPRISGITVTQLGKTATFLNPLTNTQDLLNDRPPLQLVATVNAANGGSATFVVLHNHLRSFLGMDDPVDGARVRAKRLAQAEFLANVIQTRQSANANERIFITGDFNAYEFNDGFVDVVGSIVGNPTPATQVTLAGSDLVNPNLTRLADAAADYSYVFDGFIQNIDHIFVNQGLLNNTLARRLEHIRINADYPETARNGLDNVRLSDHDALVAYARIASLGSIATSCALTSTTAAPSVGSPVSYSVQLTPSTAQGSVTVSASASESCTAVVGAGGSAVCTITYASPGARTLNASFTGTAPFQNTSCGPLSQTIAAASSNKTLVSSLNPSFIGQAVTFTASVTGVNPTGMVSFLSGGATLGSAALQGSGNTKTATFVIANLPVGSSMIVARYAGDANNQASDSPALTQVVQAGQTSTTLTLSPPNAVFLQPVTLRASVLVLAPAVGPATGEVVFFADGIEIGRAPLSNSEAVLQLASPPIGARRYSARYLGSTAYQQSVSNVELGAVSVQQVPSLSILAMLGLILLSLGIGLVASRQR
jgi:uncharacterized protein